MTNLRKSLLSTAIIAATLGLTGCGGSDNDKDPVNKAPESVSVSAMAIKDDMLGAVIGELSATSASDDANTSHTFTVDDPRFMVDGTQLKLIDTVAINFEQTKEVVVKVTATDGAGLSVTTEFTLTAEDVATENGVNVYEFASNLTENESSVSYTGQIARHAISAEIKDLMSSLSVENIEEEGILASEVETRLNQLWGFGEDDYELHVADTNIEHLGDDLSGYKQQTFGDISGSGKELHGKVAGNDDSKMYEAWLVEGNFQGWETFGEFAKTPEGLVQYFIKRLVAQVAQVNNGEKLVDVNGVEITKAYITPEGLDLVQLLQKHTLGAVMFSQGTDDYLGEGLASDNTESYKGKNYTALEHQFDEGFGYFGAARDYLEYSDKEIAKKVKSEADGRADYNGKHDTNQDGVIDLAAEFIWGNASNAAKRDLGAKGVATDFTAQAMTNFIAARKMIDDKHGMKVEEFSAEEQAKFNQHVADAALAWEKAIAATVVHYINDSLDDDDGDIDHIISGEYTTEQFATYAKHWGEMKGFALNFQFSPFSPFAGTGRDATRELTEKQKAFGPTKFAELHALIPEAPVVDAAGADEAKAKLIEARDMLQAAYDFDADNVAGW